jgi:ribosomal protein L37AE/L43A
MQDGNTGALDSPTDTDAQPGKEATDHDVVECCPHCDHSRLSYRKTADNYLCRDCRAVFDEPAERHSIMGLRGLARRAALTDSDDLEDPVDRGDGIETDGGRDSPKGDFRITLDRDDVQHLMKNGTSVVQKDVGPITVNVRTHQQLNAVVTVSGRRKDPDPERVDE